MLILCTFCAAQNRSFKQKFIPKRSQNWVIFAKKRKNCFAFLFWDLRLKSQIFTPHPCPPILKIFYLIHWTVNKKLLQKTGWPGRSNTGRPAGQPAMILKFTGLVGSRKSWPVPSLNWTVKEHRINAETICSENVRQRNRWRRNGGAEMVEPKWSHRKDEIPVGYPF